MSNYNSYLIKYIEKLIEESKNIAPSILRFDNDGNYGSVTDEYFKHDKYLRWDIEVKSLLKNMTEKFQSEHFKDLYSQYENNKKETVHSKSIYVHRSKQILAAALHFLRSNILTSQISEFNEPDFYNKTPGLDIFISHSNFDKDIAEYLIEILITSLNLKNDQIRCTSVDGYKLPGGVNTDEILRTEVHDSKIFIGIITHYSLNSAFVLFELGARWGSGRPIIPVLAKGIKPSHLKGPLDGINCLSCVSSAQIHQLIDQIAEKLNIPKQGTSSYQNKIDKFVKYSNAFKFEHSFVESSDQELLFEDGMYWMKKGDKKEGPFCQVCKEKDDKLIRLSEDEVDEDYSKLLPIYYCRVCRNTYNRDLDYE